MEGAEHKMEVTTEPGKYLGKENRLEISQIPPSSSPFVCVGFKISSGRGYAAVSHRSCLDLVFRGCSFLITPSVGSWP